MLGASASPGAAAAPQVAITVMGAASDVASPLQQPSICASWPISCRASSAAPLAKRGSLRPFSGCLAMSMECLSSTASSSLVAMAAALDASPSQSARNNHHTSCVLQIGHCVLRRASGCSPGKVSSVRSIHGFTEKVDNHAPVLNTSQP